MDPSILSLNWTASGGRRIGLPTPDFWHQWKRARQALEAAGLTVGQFDAVAGDYQLIWTPKSTVPEWINEKLRDYQRPAVTTLVEGVQKWRRVLDASQTGLGKTHNALATVASLGKRPFVVCRRAAIKDWERSGSHYGFSDIQVLNYEQLKTGKHLEVAQWVVERKRNGRKYERFQWFLPKDEFVLVWDEVHAVRAFKQTQNAEMHINSTALDYQQVNLSATAANQPLHLRALGYALGLHRLSDFESYLLKAGYDFGKFGLEWTCGMSTGERFAFTNGAFHERPAAMAKLKQFQREHMLEIHRSIFDSGKGVRLRKEEIPGFPITTIIPQLMDFGGATAKIQEAYERLRKRLKSLDGKKNRLAILTEEAVEVERLKVPLVAEEIKDSISEGFRCPVFLHFNNGVDEMCRILKTDCVVRGGQSEATRRANIDAFQANQRTEIILNAGAGSESISLHDTTGDYPRMSYIFPSFFAERIRQCIGRIQRDGVKVPTTQKIPFAAGTVEEKMMEAFESKCANIDLLCDGLTDEELQSCLNL